MDDNYDLIITGGRVIDPLLNLDKVTEVAVTGSRIRALGDNLYRTKKTKIIDGKGLIVVPGLIDLHVHTFERQSLGINGDIMLKHGVTTVVDAGSAGPLNWTEFKESCVDKCKIRVLAFLHVCKTGLDNTETGELLDMENMDIDKTVQTIKQFPTLIRGVKLRVGDHLIGVGIQADMIVEGAINAARQTDTPIMIHIGNAPMALARIVEKMKPGDMITHTYKGGNYYNNLFGENSTIDPLLFEARKKGVIFDVGHGAGSFDFNVAERAFEKGFFPGSISTDLHQTSIKRAVFDMPRTMSKFLMLGMTLKEVIRLSTLEPARILGLDKQIGSLSPGYEGDIALLDYEEGDIEMEDSYGNVRMAKGILKAKKVFKGGIQVL